jgi:3-dehydrosphinganine reductase
MSLFKIVVAGLLGLPCLLVTAAVAPVIAILSIPPLLLLVFRQHHNEESAMTAMLSIPDHVIVVGGSSGIGLSIAKECAIQGIKKITILARTQKRLDEAKAEIEAVCKTNSHSTTTVQTFSVSVSDYQAVEKAANHIMGTDKRQQQKDERVVLFNCAGISYTADFENIPIDVYRKLIDTNQLGAMYVARAFLPHMHHGCIVFCSSAAGQVGVYGYTVYSATKCALRGFAQTLHMELIRSKPGVSVQIAFPVDTDTPGYEVERAMMPEITKILNENAGLETPEDTARIMVKSAFAKHPKFQVYFTFEGWMLSNLTAGMSPVSGIGDAITQVALSGLFRFISLFYLNDFWRIIRNHKDNDNEKKSAKESIKAGPKSD